MVTILIPGELVDGLVLEPGGGDDQIVVGTEVKESFTITVNLIRAMYADD